MEALPLMRLLHENMAIVITFVFSQAPIKRLIKPQRPIRARQTDAFTDFLSRHRPPAAPAMAIFSRDRLLRGRIEPRKGSVVGLSRRDQRHIERRQKCHSRLFARQLYAAVRIAL